MVVVVGGLGYSQGTLGNVGTHFWLSLGGDATGYPSGGWDAADILLCTAPNISGAESVTPLASLIPAAHAKKWCRTRR